MKSKRRSLMALFSVVVLRIPVGSVQAQPAPVEEYSIHTDGGIIYDPLRREAESTGQLTRYQNVSTNRRTVTLGPFEARFAIPEKAAAYDVVPILYELSWRADNGNPPAKFPIAIEAVAFEDESRRKERDLFDLALPGRIDLDVEYLGSITAHLRPNGRHNIKPDMSDQPGRYPPFDRKPFVRSGAVEAGDLVWFKFRYTNTGNTILDPEGLGGCQFYPELLRKGAEGRFKRVGHPYNLYVRDLEYLYPGESHEAWFHFTTAAGEETPQNFGLVPGEYLLRLRLVYRRYTTPAPFINIWDGPPAVIWEMPFRVEKEARQAPVPPGRKTMADAAHPADAGESDKLTRFIHTFEEFMTAFDCHLARPPGECRPGGESSAIRSALHLQVAPWTKHVVVKLIRAKPLGIATVALPLAVDPSSLRIRFDPDPPASLIKDGRREPIIASQLMADMRSNVQLGPFPEQHIPERLREMQDCGINLTCTTNMPWLYDDMHQPKANYQGDALKYVLDCARSANLPIQGSGTYPFDQTAVGPIAGWVTGKPLTLDEYTTGFYGAVSQSDPQLPVASAAVWLYQFHRWGDLYCQLERGEVPIAIEDTRGWLRQDVQIRLPIGDRTRKAFAAWAQSKYGRIEAANTAWGAAYAGFDEIDPEKDQVVNRFGHRWEYLNRTNPFHDWSRAVADLDTFRTELRVKNYRETLDIVRQEIPGAAICLRTEGANVIVAGLDPASRNSHFRHIYYSQRRCALIPEILRKSGIIAMHSDYTTLPYTPSELRKLTRMAVAQGIIPCYFPQFDNLRDMAINERYGTDYQVHYNLPQPRKGYMMHCLTAVYPWFQATYEEGGIPGILWEDYQCDGFATETQKREMRLFSQKLREAISTPQAIAARGKDVQPPAQEWRQRARAKPSYHRKGE